MTLLFYCERLNWGFEMAAKTQRELPARVKECQREKFRPRPINTNLLVMLKLIASEINKVYYVRLLNEDGVSLNHTVLLKPASSCHRIDLILLINGTTH